MNLLQETIGDIYTAGYTIDDIEFVLCYPYKVTWDEYTESADFEYDNDFGFNEINMDLKILFKDGAWLEREEHDGKEWFKLQCKPNIDKYSDKICAEGFKFIIKR